MRVSVSHGEILSYALSDVHGVCRVLRITFSGGTPASSETYARDRTAHTILRGQFPLSRKEVPLGSFFLFVFEAPASSASRLSKHSLVSFPVASPSRPSFRCTASVRSSFIRTGLWSLVSSLSYRFLFLKILSWSRRPGRNGSV